MLTFLVLAIASVLIATAFVPLLPVDWWWVRIGDFPRVQLLVSYLVCLVIVAFMLSQPYAKVAAGLLVASICIQLYWVFPYLPVAPYQVQPAKSDDSSTRLQILTANVLQDNTDASALVQLVKSESPDVCVLCEVNQRWIEDLAPLREQFQHHIEHPLENKYGIALYTNLELVSGEVRAMVKETIPSIDAEIQLASGHSVRLFAVHPNPPRPGEDTTKRDGELVLVGRDVRDSESVIVLGDMNDVGWSRTTDLFQEVSGLLDPRKGRGLYATFNAKSWIWRYPLDHLFHSKDFRVVSLRTLPPIGSDHLPLSVILSHEPEARATQSAPHLDAGDAEDAEAAVEALNEPGALDQPKED
ncbi:endonuclease/exonuclease/phosphatase family protein [Allorhodopirellula heiligendammensis]|uniref:Endonuclease/Exonuclease/phosphatase family protein n=1 Tax=Allorhodopirellula heiligendammensis TaxID=2714739 RepID=A0A5C6BTV4_9BACT|nr:endonuclease/exonuclease/phosphatase family protein [Allorhodopirellula heiligendammensis]TWU15660.1 Endonuclease/Exonuclease/phosphatase family protein [Allorhodopirellula heiligendammensis]